MFGFDDKDLKVGSESCSELSFRIHITWPAAYILCTVGSGELVVSCVVGTPPPPSPPYGEHPLLDIDEAGS